MARWCMVFAVAYAGAACGAETISGQVTDTGAIPLGGIDLDVFDAAGNVVAVTGGVSDPSGQYTIALPGPGSYIVRADARLADGYVDEYWNEVFLKSQAQAINVGAGQAVTGIDFTLAVGAEIRGTVRTAVGGTPLAGIDLDLFASTGEFLGSYPGATVPDGTYAVGALPPGNYILRADPDPVLGQYYVRTYYGNQRSMASATLVALAGTTVTGIDIALEAGGTIRGYVTDAGTAQPLAGIDIDLFDAAGQREEANVRTDLSGFYEIGPVIPGNYYLRVDPTIAQGYPRTYYPAAYRESDAQPIPVYAGTQTSGVNFALSLGGTIGGSVLDAVSSVPLVGIDLDCYDFSGKRIEVTAATGAGGVFQIGPLAAGYYLLRADPPLASGYAPQFYLAKVDAALANAILVVPGQETSGIDFHLESAGWIQGVVRNALAQPVAGVDLDLYDAATGTRLRQGATTGLDGGYLLSPVAPGQYHLRCDSSLGQSYAMQYYNGQMRLAAADTVVVAPGGGVSSIDFTLNPGGSISGRVTRAPSSDPLSGMDMDVFQAGTFLRMDQDATTNATGYYSLDGLPVGDYIVRADPSGSHPGFRMTYYGGVTLMADAVPVSVGPSAAVAGIDVVLLESELPAAGGVGLGLMAAATLTGAFVFRRGKRPQMPQEK